MAHPRTSPRATRALRGTTEALAAAGLMPDGGHTVPGPDGVSVAATSSNRGIRRLRRRSATERDLMFAGGWHVTSIKGGDAEGGITSHRGVLHPDEYVDEDVLLALVERELGFTHEQVRSVYRQGPLSNDQRGLRGRIDDRVLALSRAGGNMAELGRVLGFHVDNDGHCEALRNAITRAKKEES